MSAVLPPVRAEYEHVLDPLPEFTASRRLSLASRLAEQQWLRRLAILVALAAIWEVVARIQDNDLMLPTFLQTARALFEGLASGELVEKARISLGMLLQGYLGGVAAAFMLTSLAVASRFGRDLLSTL